MNIFSAIGTSLDAVTSTFVTAARTCEKSVRLVENEVNELILEQQDNHEGTKFIRDNKREDAIEARKLLTEERKQAVA